MKDECMRGYGATAARLTPDQKVGSSNLSGLIFRNPIFVVKRFSNNEKLKVRRIISFRARQETTSKVSYFGDFCWKTQSCSVHDPL